MFVLFFKVFLQCNCWVFILKFLVKSVFNTWLSCYLPSVHIFTSDIINVGLTFTSWYKCVTSSFKELSGMFPVGTGLRWRSKTAMIKCNDFFHSWGLSLSSHCVLLYTVRPQVSQSEFSGRSRDLECRYKAMKDKWREKMSCRGRGGGVVTTSVGNCGERERRREEGRWKLIEGGSY